ncbi:MAG: phosphoribosylformylglycinamidine synthase subunit PurQ [Saprospiraceae bacterium]|nr:phosphoribosylformylglycinamidine synthase subunit PurQ [Saprospiraceae bacterium]MDW8483744.1 phosphoribosylformylglycinamidine synthase subunit PurQ [Saprospiraceae bacterium]
MKFGVIVFPGSNCDDDMVHVLREVLHQPVEKIWHKEVRLPSDVDCIVLPGGFSYGDYVRAGAIARFSPIMRAVRAFAQQGGLVLGICNGFQILCESGLLPGVLLRNAQQQFICDNVWIRPATTRSPLTACLSPDRALQIPIAHAEGRYYADEETLKRLEANEQVLFRYCTPSGEITPEANPNGSLHHIAGVCNEQRNVMGMMPHPERAAEEVLGNTDGRLILESLIATSVAV